MCPISSIFRSISMRTSKSCVPGTSSASISLRETAFQNPQSYFHRYASLTDDEAHTTADKIWETINLANLRENVLPTRRVPT